MVGVASILPVVYVGIRLVGAAGEGWFVIEQAEDRETNRKNRIILFPTLPNFRVAF